jgi:hypothetical protein
MKPEEYRFAIPLYLGNQLNLVDRAAFEQELSNDPALRAETEELRAVWTGLGLLPDEQPSAAMRARFYQTLHRLNKEPEPHATTSSWLRLRPIQSLAAAIFVFCFGVLADRAGVIPGGSTNQIAQLRKQVQDLEQLTALSMLDRQSASARLEGVSWGSRMEHPDRQVATALLTALNHDPNVNVRLSSADALEKFAGDESVRRGLIDSLPLQDSPLVQIALIDTLVQLHQANAAAEFRRLAAKADANPNVRQRAQWALQQLGSY